MNNQNKDEREIEIKHKIKVDSCIADEILELNNKYNILTLMSCCGHGNDEDAFIVVHEDDLEKMISELEYDITGKVYIERAHIDEKDGTEIKESIRWSISLRPKSKCRCKTNINNLLT